MGKTTVGQNGNNYFIANKLVYPEAINERELDAIAAGVLDRFALVTAEKKKKKVTIKCSINGMMPLKEYFGGFVNKKMFVDIVRELIDIVKECDTQYMNYRNIIWDINFLFLNPRTKALKCVYWPIVNNSSARNVEDFFAELPFELVFDKYEDSTYVSKYISFFNGVVPFSINRFDKIISEISDVSSEITQEESDVLNSEINRSGQIENIYRKGTTGSIDYNPIADRKNNKPVENIITFTCPNCGYIQKEKNGKDLSNVICYRCGKVINKQAKSALNNENAYFEKPENNAGTTVLGVEAVEQETQVISSNVVNANNAPYIIRVKTNEKIYISKKLFVIGIDSRCCDYVISDSSVVSRRHAGIVAANGKYYIVDYNSTNKTLINGQVITENIEVELTPGTYIELANEKFIFYF